MGLRKAAMTIIEEKAKLQKKHCLSDRVVWCTKVNSIKSKKRKEQEKPIEEQFVLSARKQHCQEIE